MIRKILITLFVLAAALAVLAFAVVRMVDFDQLRQKIVVMAESALGTKVELQKIGLSWRGGPELRLEKLGVYGKGEFAAEPIVSARAAYARLNWHALLQRRVVVDYVVFDAPQITVIRGRSGTLNTEALLRPQELEAPAGPEKAKGGGGADRLEAGFVTSRFIVKDGTVRYVDRTGVPPSEFAVNDIDVEVRDLSVTRPVLFVLQAAVLESDSQNVVLKGKLGPLGPKRDLSKLKAELELDFSLVDFNRVKAKSPLLKDLPFTGRAVKGKLSGKVAGLRFAPDGRFMGLDAELTADFPEVRLAYFRAPIRALSSRVLFEGDRVLIERGDASIGEQGKIGFSGGVDGWLSRSPRQRLKASLRGIEAHDLTTFGGGETDFGVYGRVNGDLEVGFNGFRQSEIVSSMTGGGQVEITQGLVKNLNVLAKVLGKITTIPFIGDALYSVISPRHRALLQQRDVRVNLAQSRFVIGGGNVRVSEINLESDGFSVNGSGHISLLGRLNLRCWLILSPELTAELVRGFDQLGALADPYGRLVFPFTVAGETAHPRVATDSDYVMSRLLPASGQKLINSFLNKGTDAAQGTGSQAQDILKKLIQQ